MAGIDIKYWLANPIQGIVAAVVLGIAIEILATETLPAIFTAFIQFSGIGGFKFAKYFAPGGVGQTLLSVVVLGGIFFLLMPKGGKR